MFSDKDGRSAFAARRQVVEPHALVHARLRPGRTTKLTAPITAPTWSKTRCMRFCTMMFLPSHIVPGTALAVRVGYLGWDAYTGMSFVVWGMFVRLIYVCTSPGSSIRPATSGAIATTKPPTTAAICGGSACWPSAKAGTTTITPIQRMARQGHKWWEVDVTYWAICLMEKLGLAWNVVHSVPRIRSRRNSVDELPDRGAKAPEGCPPLWGRTRDSPRLFRSSKAPPQCFTLTQRASLPGERNSAWKRWRSGPIAVECRSLSEPQSPDTSRVSTEKLAQSKNRSDAPKGFIQRPPATLTG